MGFCEQYPAADITAKLVAKGLAEADDDQLVAELQRRHPNRAAMLGTLTDGELRAECARRGIQTAAAGHESLVHGDALVPTSRSRHGGGFTV